MVTTFLPRTLRQVRCYYRPLLLAIGFSILLTMFWFASRYPQLLRKSEHLGEPIPSMAYSAWVLHVPPSAPLWQRVGAAMINWLDSMKIGMTFGVLFGALLHTWLRYYPLRIGSNLYLNSVKGALVGVPMGVCANCAVPAACGVTRGNGRVEVALAFLFSSPNFNPVVMMMTFSALPWTVSVAKYAVLLFVILLFVPSTIRWLERDHPLPVFNVTKEGSGCPLQLSVPECDERFATVTREVMTGFARHVWMLLKPTIAIMLVTSLFSAVLLTLLPWESLLADPSPTKLALVGLISVAMPVPIALDVMFAAQLQQQGADPSYVMLFAMTLGTFSIVPTIYLWREISKSLSVVLFVFFVAVGWCLAMLV